MTDMLVLDLAAVSLEPDTMRINGERVETLISQLARDPDISITTSHQLMRLAHGLDRLTVRITGRTA